MWKHLQTIVYIFCLLKTNFAENVIEVGDQSFVKHRDTTVK